MTARELLGSAAEELELAGCPSPRVDAEWLLAHALGMTRTELYADGKPAADRPRRATRVSRELVARRAQREPLAYVLGEWGFRRLTLRVDSRVLIPRPETEALVERASRCSTGLPEPRVLDIGVGSGAIALAIADEHPRARVVATDSSAGAIAVADENRRRTALTERVELVRGELFAGLGGPFDLVVSNPPYVAPDEIDRLDPEVARYEPREALVACGTTEAIAEQARSRLAPGGSLVLETGDGQASGVAELLTGLGYHEVSIGQDLAGRERVVEGREPR